MALIDDVTVYPYSKVFRQTNSSSTTIYSVNDFFSWVMQLFDEPGYLTFSTPMKYNTPTSYTMLNGWFLDNGDGSNILKYLHGGDIGTSGYANDILVQDYDTITVDVDSGDLDETVTGATSGAIGPLLAFKASYPSGGGRLWIRDVNTVHPTTDGEALTTSTGMDVDADGVSVTGEENYANPYALASFIGSPNPQVYFYWNEPKTGTYERVDEWSALDNWDRDSGTISGFDVLIPVRIGGVLNNSGYIDVFARQTGDTFTHVKDLDLSAGARTPVSLETAADTVNITTGEWYLLVDGGTTISTDFSAGDIIQDVSTASTSNPSWYAEVVSVTEFSVATTGVLVLRGLRGTISDNDSIFVGTTDTADANGTPGDTYISHTGAGTEPDGVTDMGLPFEGGTSGAHRILRGYDNAENVLVAQVYHTHGTTDSQDYTGSGRDALYKDFSSGEVIDAPTSGTSDISLTTNAVSTTLTSGFSDITIAHINGVSTTGSFTSGPFIEGERVTWNGGTSSAIVVNWVTDTSLTLANVDPTDEPADTDVLLGDLSGASATQSGAFADANTSTFAFPLQTARTYSVFINGGNIYNTGRTFADINAYCQFRCGDGAQGESATDPRRVMSTSDGSSITELNGEAYITAKSTYTVSKPYPFGQKAGDSFFAAQGIFIRGMDSDDFNNVRLTDDGGTARQPETSITLSVTNTRAYDRILVALKDSSLDLPDKTQYTSHATANSQGDGTLEQNEAGGGFPNDTPASGAVFVIDNGTNEEHRYRYASWANDGGSGDDGNLTLATSDAGTAAATGNGSGGINGTTGYQYLTASAAVFDDVEVGDIIRRTNNEGGWAYVTAVNSTTEIETTKLSTPANVYWDATATADTFETNLLVETYDGSDTFYIPYMDVIEDTGTEGSPGEEEANLTYAANRNLIAIYRNVDPSATTPIQPLFLTATMTTSGASFNLVRNEDEVGSY
jgi:hypothetical protein